MNWKTKSRATNTASKSNCISNQWDGLDVLDYKQSRRAHQAFACKYCGRAATDDGSILFHNTASCGRHAQLREITDPEVRAYWRSYRAKWRLI